MGFVANEFKNHNSGSGTAFAQTNVQGDVISVYVDLSKKTIGYEEWKGFGSCFFKC
jgi:hypothetical protein